MYRIDVDTIPDWHPTWDPVEFQQHHPQVSIEQHRFSHEMLETMAIKTMIIRQKIMAKAERMKSLRPIIVRPNIQSRTRNGQKYSTAKNNPEGLSEKEMRQRVQDENPPSRKYKARPRSKLSSKEIANIVKAYKTESLNQIEIAKKYRITSTLVHRLVKEAKVHPEKLQNKKDKE